MASWVEIRCLRCEELSETDVEVSKGVAPARSEASRRKLKSLNSMPPRHISQAGACQPYNAIEQLLSSPSRFIYSVPHKDPEGVKQMTVQSSSHTLEPAVLGSNP